MAWPFIGDQPKIVCQYYDYKYNTASGTCSGIGPSVLGKIKILGGTMGLLTVYDSTAASAAANMAFQITPSISGEEFQFDVRFKKGISIFASAATSYVVTYQS